MIITVIPLIKLPRNLVYFDYEISPDISIDKYSLVIVPWRKTKIFALVVDNKKAQLKPQITLKKIIKPINQGKPIATPTQFKLIDQLAKDFLTSPSIWWKNLLPQFPKKSEINLTNIEKNKLIENKIKNNHKMKLELANSFDDMVASLISKINKDYQQLILCPELVDIDILYKKMPLELKQVTTIYHKGLKNKELINNYFKILNNEAKIIIGTKLSFLLPFHNLKTIYVFKSENYGFSSNSQNPRYNLDSIYSYLKKFYQANIILYSFSPWVDTYAYFKKEKQEITDKQVPLNFKLIDMTLEKKANNFSYLSWPLEQAIKNTLNTNKKCLLLVNRKGYKQKLYCQDCGWSPSCEQCGGYLKLKDFNSLQCGICQTAYPVPEICPHCQSVRLKNYGLTNKILVENLKIIFPQKQIVFVDNENKFLPDNSKIVVATKYFISHLKNDFGLIAFIDADQELVTYNFRSFELAWQFFNNAFRMLADCQKFVQTKKADHYLWNYLSNYSYHKFWLKEMSWRKKMNFPPYTKIVKLIIKKLKQNKNKLTAEQIISKLSCNFIKFISVDNLEIVFSFPADKYKDVYKILSKLPEYITIEFNPYEI